MPSVSRLAAVAAHLRPRAAAAQQQQQYSEQQPVVASPEEIQVLRGNGQAEPRNKPRGDKLQGYGIIGEQPRAVRRGIAPQMLKKAFDLVLNPANPVHANIRAALATALPQHLLGPKSSQVTSSSGPSGGSRSELDLT